MQARTPKRQGRVATAGDIEVGRRIRIRRQTLNMSQEKLGEHLGVTFQQIQKYEKGVNRVGAGRLMQIAQALNCSAESLLGEQIQNDAAESPSELLSGPQALELILQFRKLDSADLRRSIVSFVAQLAETRALSKL